MRPIRLAALLCSFVAVGCSSKVSQTVDTELQAKVDLVRQCVPLHLEVLTALIEFADLWRLNGTENPPDPAGLTWSEQSGGAITYTIGPPALTGFQVAGEIRFYDPAGVQQDLNLPTTSLSQAIDDAATQLRNLFGAADKFMVGTWNVTDTGGTVESGTGALTAIIGGSTNQNELEELRTTTATPAGGPPPNATGSLQMVDSNGTCTLAFDTPHAPATSGLRTDTQPTQEYPIGTVHFALARGTTTVDADLTFDGTVTARLTVTGITGRFDINLETLTVTFVP